MLLSGQNFFRIYDKLKDVHSMPIVFAEAGYSTFGTGKWHNEKEAFEASFQQRKMCTSAAWPTTIRFPCAIWVQMENWVPLPQKDFPRRSLAQTAIDFIQCHKNANSGITCKLFLGRVNRSYSPFPKGGKGIQKPIAGS